MYSILLQLVQVNPCKEVKEADATIAVKDPKHTNAKDPSEDHQTKDEFIIHDT